MEDRKSGAHKISDGVLSCMAYGLVVRYKCAVPERMICMYAM